MSKDKIIYWGSTGLLAVWMLFSAGMYVFNYEMVVEIIRGMGYPEYIIYPLAVAKVLAVIAILTKKSEMLKEWAYAGLFFDFVLAASGHIMAGDGDYAPALVAIVVLFISYSYDRKLFPRMHVKRDEALGV